MSRVAMTSWPRDWVDHRPLCKPCP